MRTPAAVLLVVATLVMLPAAASDASPTSQAPAPERLTADTPKTTVRGNTFIAPAGWTVSVRGAATILEPPEAGSRIALIDVRATDADAAVAAAWELYDPAAKRPLKVATDVPDKDGWSKQPRRTPTRPRRTSGATSPPACATPATRWTVVDLRHGAGRRREARRAGRR